MEFISEGIFEKYSKMEILVFDFFEKGQILRPFSSLAPSKRIFFQQKFNGSIYQKNEGGGGVESTPPPGPCSTKKSMVLRGFSSVS